MNWHIRVEEHESDGLELALRDGWEPFAVTHEPVYNNPDSGWKVTGHEPHVWLRKVIPQPEEEPEVIEPDPGITHHEPTPRLWPACWTTSASSRAVCTPS